MGGATRFEEATGWVGGWWSRFGGRVGGRVAVGPCRDGAGDVWTGCMRTW